MAVEEDYVLIGHVTGVHGLHGNLKVHSYTDSLDLYKKGEKLLIRRTGRSENLAGQTLTIRSVSPYKKKILLKFDEIENIDSAECLIGADILILREKFPDLDDGEYYWVDIIGLEVFTDDEKLLGKVDSIFQTGSNDVYVVKDGKGGEVLVPALESVIKDIDLKAGIMTVALPDGL